MKHIKTIIYSLGVATLVALPISTVTSCSYLNEQKSLENLTLQDVINRTVALITKTVIKTGNLMSTITPGEVQKYFFYASNKVNGKTHNNSATIQMNNNTDTTKDFDEVFVILEATPHNSAGTLTINVLAIYTVHKYFSNAKQNPNVFSVKNPFLITGFLKTKSPPIPAIPIKPKP